MSPDFPLISVIVINMANINFKSAEEKRFMMIDKVEQLGSSENGMHMVHLVRNFLP